MRSRPIAFALLGLLGLATLRPVQAQVTAAPSLMNFQGRLAKSDGTPVANGTYSIRFSLWDAASDGNEKWNQTINNVTVTNGTFAVLLNTDTAGLFNANLYLEIKIGTDAPLTPRQQMVSVAYAMKANSVADGSITGASLANGTITAAKFASDLFNPLVWLLGGNSSTNPASHFLGTTDNQPLVFKSNGRRAMQFQYAERSAFRSSNVLGGSDINFIGAGVVGATIVGGGQDNVTGTDYPNRILVDFGTVGGGYGNTAGGAGTVGGGWSNTAGAAGTVAGGGGNSANNNYAAVGGGYGNNASGQSATIGGGSGNAAGGDNATVPGGQSNTASGLFSFAAGRRAKANHDGAFVWADAQNADFASNAANQFLIRASGGVGVGTDAPQSPLHVRGFQGALSLEGTTNHVYIQFFPRGVAAGRQAYIGFPAAGSHDFEIANEDTGVLRVRGTFVNDSDIRWKTNILPIENALDGILNLRGVTYDWKRDVPGAPTSIERQVGLIAQEVEKVFPELVHTNEKGYKAVNYLGAVPVLIEAVKAQQKQMETFQKENNTAKQENITLKSEVAVLKAKNAALEARLERLEAAAPLGRTDFSRP